ncbi:MAG: energy transducer TonB [Planctomycetes bacterium]|nr:energy transducer TonB [Planctomycetota bacterium]
MPTVDCNSANRTPRSWRVRVRARRESDSRVRSWGFVGSVTAHALALGSVAWMALSGRVGSDDAGTLVAFANRELVEALPAAPALEREPRIEPEELLEPTLLDPELAEEPEPQPEPRLPTATVVDDPARVAHLLSLPWSSSSARVAGDSASTSAGEESGVASEQAAPSAASTPPQPAPEVEPLVTPVATLSAPDPTYPRLSQRLGEQGTVELHMFVGADGKLVRADVIRSSGFERLDRAALDAVSRWTFRAATRDGSAVMGEFQHRFVFRIES